METFYCPRCKTKIYDEEDGYGEVCSHVAFAYLSLIGDFETITEEVKEFMHGMKTEIDDQEEFVNELVERMKNKIDLYTLEDSGADSCGLHYTVLYIGIWKRI